MKYDLTQLKQDLKYAIDACNEYEIRYAEIWDLMDDVKKLIKQLEEKE
jgi:hypothetical protein